MTINDALQFAFRVLIKTSATPALDAEVLLKFILNKSVEFIYAHSEIKLKSYQENRYRNLIAKRKKGWPVAYLIGHKEFFGLEFNVNRHVLIPRPETELLVEETLAEIKKFKTRRIALADIGTGSGVIAVTLAKKYPDMAVYATDISARALTVARENQKKHGTKIKFYRGHLLEPLKTKKINLIVANLPYVKKTKKTFNSKLTNSLKFEPTKALFAAHNGLDVYFNFVTQLATLSTPPQIVLIEIGYNQKESLIKKIKSLFPQVKIETKKDLAGHDRLLKCYLANYSKKSLKIIDGDKK